jgi:hypothetical protein
MSKFSKAANLFEISTQYCSLPSTLFTLITIKTVYEDDCFFSKISKEAKEFSNKVCG